MKGKSIVQICIFCSISFFIVFSSQHLFATKIKISTDKLIKLITDRATLIVTGEVINIESQKDCGFPSINTYITIQVDECIKGSLQRKEVSVRIPGGVVGKESLSVEDTPIFVTSEKVLLFLKPRPKDLKNFLIVEDIYGKYQIGGVTQTKPVMKVEELIQRVKERIKNQSPRGEAPFC
jgi:hypothetical protein